MRPARIDWKIGLLALVAISPFMLAAQKPNAPGKTVTPTSSPAISKLPKLWHIDASHKDFRVEVNGDVFHADWVNLHAAAAKVGAYMRIECRRTGTKWLGSATVYQGTAVPGAPAGKETKMCHFTVRFEVDSITPEKIVFHTEALRNMDAAKCQLLQTAWEEFAWVPKK